jgi:hypothetical protein
VFRQSGDEQNPTDLTERPTPLGHRMGGTVKIKPISKMCDVFAWL